MRKSKRTLLTALGIAALGLIVAIGALRVTLSGFSADAYADTTGNRERSSESAFASVNLSGFEHILIRDSCVVEVT